MGKTLTNYSQIKKQCYDMFQAIKLQEETGIVEKNIN